MLGFMRKVRNGIIIGTGHVVGVALISKVLYPIASWSGYLGFKLLVGTWNAHWLAGLTVTGFVAAGAWAAAERIIPLITDSKLLEEIKDKLTDNDLFYLVTGWGVPLAIAVVSPLTGALSAMALGPLSLNHHKDINLNVRNEGEDSVLMGLLTGNQRNLERVAGPYLAPHAELRSLLGPDLAEDSTDFQEPNSRYDSEDEESEIEPDVTATLGSMTQERTEQMTVGSAQGTVLERIPFFGRFFKETPTVREIEPMGNSAGSHEHGGYNLRTRAKKD